MTAWRSLIGVILIAALSGCGSTQAPSPALPTIVTPSPSEPSQAPSTAPTPASLSLSEPFDIVEQPDGSYLVADRTANAVYRLAGGSLTKVANVMGPRDLEPLRDGHVLVASGRAVLSLDPASGGTTTVARVREDVLGVAAAPDGTIFLSEFGTRIVRVDQDGDRVVADGLDGVHGLLFTKDGLVICESSTGRVLLLADDGTTTVLASGLSTPSFAARADGAALYVSEFDAGRISRVSPSGTTTTVAVVPAPAALSRASDGRLLVASLDGEVDAIDPVTGTVTRLD